MIVVDGLTKMYGSLKAVDGLSFSVARRGSRRPDRSERRGQDHHAEVHGRHPGARPSGSVRIDGHDIVTDAVEAKRRLAFMPDEPQLFEYLTVREHLNLVARLYRVADYAARVPRLLEELELSGKERALPGELSRGMKQKLAIACGLLHDPPVLLFDEPLTGLDPLGIRRMKQTIVGARPRRRRRRRRRRTCCTWSRRSARGS